MAKSAKSSDTESLGSADFTDVLVTPKRAKYDFFEELKAMKEIGSSLSIAQLKPGTYWNQEINLAVAWKNRTAEKCLSLHGYDGTDLIAMKAFHPKLAEFNKSLEVFSLYVISKFEVRSVEPRFAGVTKHPLEIILGNDTVVRKIENPPIRIPFNPTPLDTLKNLENGSFADIKGVIVKDSAARKTGTGKTVKEISIVDQTQETIPVFLWGTDAESLNFEMHSTVGLKGVSVRVEHDTDANSKEAVVWVNKYTSIATGAAAEPDETLQKWFKELIQGVY